MKVKEFIKKYALSPDEIPGQRCLRDLCREMELGLEGKGNLPMIPSYLSVDTVPVPGTPCCIIDAGGTNLRYARSEFDGSGRCHISGLRKTAMPGTAGALTFREFYDTLAGFVRETGCETSIGLCFSFNVLQDRTLDGILHSWCKEVRVPEAVGKPVGASLRHAVGSRCQRVRVLNDSTAALLGAHHADPRIRVGLILGTGINVCYSERCAEIPKLPRGVNAEHMIISTEIGEFRGIPKTVFDRAVIAASDEPEMAHAEKQCSGAYLGDLISWAWQTAAREGVLGEAFLTYQTLPRISDYLAGAATDIPEDAAAREIAETMVCRAAKIAAILTAAPIARSCVPGETCTMVIEGSQYSRLTGFGDSFRRELEGLLAAHGISVAITQMENSCLMGAALAAFAQPM